MRITRAGLAIGTALAVGAVATAGCTGGGKKPQAPIALQPTLVNTTAVIPSVGATTPGATTPGATTPAAEQSGAGDAQAGGPDTGTPSGEAAAAGGEGAGTEATLTTYTDPAGRFSFGYPQGWTQSTDQRGGIRFDGHNQIVMFDLIPNAGSDATAFATSDQASLAAEFPGFRQISLAASSVVRGAAVLTFEWQAANQVTGKPLLERAGRYYMPASGGRMAVLTDGAPLAQFDPQNSADLARTVRVR